MTQNNLINREQQARDRAGEVLRARPEKFSHPLTVLASPSWRGVEGDIWRANTGSLSIILKHFHPEIDWYVDTNAAVQAAEQAGKLGVGPDVLMCWASDRMFAMEDLGDSWRVGGLHDAIDPAIRNRVISQKKVFQNSAKLSKSTCIFAEIQAFLGIIQSHNYFAHRDIGVFADYFNNAWQKLQAAGMDSVPCHRDGNVSNLMVDADKNVKLLDFDLAANCDPFEDVGCYLVEFFESDAQARTGFEEWHGRFDEGLFQRSMIYGLADDMRWGLIGSIMAATSPRSVLEFSKYAAWRFLRLEAKAKQSDANNRIRSAK